MRPLRTHEALPTQGNGGGVLPPALGRDILSFIYYCAASLRMLLALFCRRKNTRAELYTVCAVHRADWQRQKMSDSHLT